MASARESGLPPGNYTNGGYADYRETRTFEAHFLILRVFRREDAKGLFIIISSGYNIGAAIDYKVIEIPPVFRVSVYHQRYGGIGGDVLNAPESLPFRFFGLFVEGGIDVRRGVCETDRNDQRLPGRGSGRHPGYPC